MLEIEVKYRLEDESAFRDALLALGAESDGIHNEQDRYFNAPDRDFAATDEALRLRSIDSMNVMTYKGPKRPGETKSREEIETLLMPGRESADEMGKILLKLGYRFVSVVRKEREGYAIPGEEFSVHATIDRVEEVGTFAELEIVTDEEGYERAQIEVLAMAKRLNLTMVERRSYLELLLRAQARQERE